jgi:predicted nucleic acid-binding protein
MKFSDVLRGHINLTAQQIDTVWSQAHFCLDTNVWLDLYRYSEPARKQFLRLLGGMKGRLFVPNRVAVEFARNRRKVILAHHAPHRRITATLEKASKEITEGFKKHPDQVDTLRLIASAKMLMEQQFGSAEKKHNDLLNDDPILTAILGIVDEIGDPLPKEDAEKEHERRKNDNIPPYCKTDDSDKEEESPAGDVVLWLELLRQYDGSGKPLIFVTGDMKPNWWLTVEGRHYPQPNLVQEAYERTKGDILFYASERFINTASARLGVEVPKTLAEETKKIRQQEEERIEGARRVYRTTIRSLAVSDPDVLDYLRSRVKHPEEIIRELMKGGRDVSPDGLRKWMVFDQRRRALSAKMLAEIEAADHRLVDEYVASLSVRSSTETPPPLPDQEKPEEKK